MNNLEWLTNLVNALPEEPKITKTIFDIAGFPKWETVNSNFLAFYFDKEEEHLLGTLFIESLVALLGVQTEVNIEDKFEVLREVRTPKGKFIDVVIKNIPEEDLELQKEEEEPISDWVIIIENKIDAPLYNNLYEYWNSVKSERKIGVVLSRNSIDMQFQNNKFINITHQDLNTKVQQNLHKYFNTANEKHLLLLREYLNNINNLYLENEMDKQQTLILDNFIAHYKEIEQLKKVEMNLMEAISNDVFKILKFYHFDPYSSKTSSKTKHFYINEEGLKDKYEGLRLWVNLERMMQVKYFEAVFELHGYEFTKYGSKLKQYLSSKSIYTTAVKEATKGGDTSGYCQLFYLYLPIEFSETVDFSTALKESLDKYFFKHPNNFLEVTANYLLELRKQDGTLPNRES